MSNTWEGNDDVMIPRDLLEEYADLRRESRPEVARLTLFSAAMIVLGAVIFGIVLGIAFMERMGIR